MLSFKGADSQYQSIRFLSEAKHDRTYAVNCMLAIGIGCHNTNRPRAVFKDIGKTGLESPSLSPVYFMPEEDASGVSDYAQGSVEEFRILFSAPVINKNNIPKTTVPQTGKESEQSFIRLICRYKDRNKGESSTIHILNDLSVHRVLYAFFTHVLFSFFISNYGIV